MHGTALRLRTRDAEAHDDNAKILKDILARNMTTPTLSDVQIENTEKEIRWHESQAAQIRTRARMEDLGYVCR